MNLVKMAFTLVCVIACWPDDARSERYFDSDGHRIRQHRVARLDSPPVTGVGEDTLLQDESIGADHAILAWPEDSFDKHVDRPCGDPTCEDCSRSRWDFSNGLFGRLHSDPNHSPSGFLDFNCYWDDREFSVLTINAGAKLPYDFEYFQFANFNGGFENPTGLEDWTDFFTEIHLRRPIAKDHPWLKHLDWNVMWADGSGPREVGRLGVRWRFQDTPGVVGDFVRDTIKLRYSLTFHYLEDDGSGCQLEHVYRRDFLDGLIYIGGFADHNINYDSGDSDWIAETQIGLKLARNFYAVAEYRYFSFAPAEFRRGWGFGLEYVVRFQ